MATKYHSYYAPRIKKNGKPGAFVLHYAEFTPLFACDVCGVLGPAKKVTYRSDCYGWNRDKDDWSTASKDTLCIGCWNRARAVQNRKWDAIQTERLINKLNKEISHERKQRQQDGSDHGRPAGLPGQHDGRREERHA